MDTLEVSNYTSFYLKKENRIMVKQIPKQCFILNQNYQNHYLTLEETSKIKRTFPLICLDQNYFYFQTRNLLGLKIDLLRSQCREN